MTGSRHWFVLEPMTLAPQFDSVRTQAGAFELAGNWYLAGETYVALQKLPNSTPVPILNAQLLARAASCFEIAQDNKISARLYEEAAQTVASGNANPQLAGELYNRAALQFRQSQEFFFAGSAWVRSAEEFSKIPATVINCSENFPPLPISAFKSHLCGACFEAAAEVYGRSSGNEMWSASTFWHAGRAYSDGIPNIQAFGAYRRSLTAHIRHYGTLELPQLRRSLPLSDVERASEINPIEIMEAALARCNNHHQKNPGDTPESRLQTDRQMAAVFHEFTLGFQAVGNTKEAGRFRAEQNERQRRMLLSQRDYSGASLYWLWQITSNYGESLGRWAATCLLVILAFATAYDVFGVVSSTGNLADKSLHMFDYFYFSVITFSTLGYGDLHPIGIIGLAMACVEVLIGFIMFGVLLSFVGNRFQRG